MFELFKAKCAAKRARREAIAAFDQYINVLASRINIATPAEERKAIADEISKIVSIKAVYEKDTEPPKWLSELITTTLKLAVTAGSVAACEIITNRGIGDRHVIDGIKQIPRC